MRKLWKRHYYCNFSSLATNFTLAANFYFRPMFWKKLLLISRSTDNICYFCHLHIFIYVCDNSLDFSFYQRKLELSFCRLANLLRFSIKIGFRISMDVKTISFRSTAKSITITQSKHKHITCEQEIKNKKQKEIRKIRFYETLRRRYYAKSWTKGTFYLFKTFFEIIHSSPNDNNVSSWCQKKMQNRK